MRQGRVGRTSGRPGISLRTILIPRLFASEFGAFGPAARLA
jgi:hypothetical protein